MRRVLDLFMQPVWFLTLVLAWTLLAGCSRSDRPTVTLYTSCDAPIARSIVERFEAESGITVKMVTDTEATKTTGLVQRLIAERGSPVADVWWSNEMLGTAQLASLRLFEPFTPACVSDFGGVWPAAWCDPSGLWYGHALRFRVIVRNTTLVAPGTEPTSLAALADPRFKGRVGMARPQFGTSRMHMAALAALHGSAAAESWLRAMLANGLRLYDGNSAVVQAVAHGEIAVGLTDSDDALQGIANRWPIAYGFEQTPGKRDPGLPPLPVSGSIAIANTVAIVRDGPHPEAARQLAEFLLSARCEQLLEASDARTLGLRGDRSKSPLVAAPAPASIDPARLVEAAGAADRLVDRVLGVR
jgi:iron(III) transport system substrate-binding protein